MLHRAGQFLLAEFRVAALIVQQPALEGGAKGQHQEAGIVEFNHAVPDSLLHQRNVVLINSTHDPL